jgi:hypothetical protein
MSNAPNEIYIQCIYLESHPLYLESHPPVSPLPIPYIDVSGSTRTGAVTADY